MIGRLFRAIFKFGGKFQTWNMTTSRFVTEVKNLVVGREFPRFFWHKSENIFAGDILSHQINFSIYEDCALHKFCWNNVQVLSSVTDNFLAVARKFPRPRLGIARCYERYTSASQKLFALATQVASFLTIFSELVRIMILTQFVAAPFWKCFRSQVEDAPSSIFARDPDSRFRVLAKYRSVSRRRFTHGA